MPAARSANSLASGSSAPISRRASTSAISFSLRNLTSWINCASLGVRPLKMTRPSIQSPKVLTGQQIGNVIKVGHNAFELLPSLAMTVTMR